MTNLIEPNIFSRRIKVLVWRNMIAEKADSPLITIMFEGIIYKGEKEISHLSNSSWFAHFLGSSQELPHHEGCFEQKAECHSFFARKNERTVSSQYRQKRCTMRKNIVSPLYDNMNEE